MLPRKPLQTDLNVSHALSSFKLRSSSKSVSFSTSRIWRPTKIPSLSLAAIRPGNTVDKCWKAAPFLCNAFTKFFIKPSLMWRGGRSTLFMSTRGFSLRLCSPGTKVLLNCQSFCWDTARLSQRQRKQQYFAKPACIPIRRPMTLRSPHRLYRYSLYLIASKRSSILS